MPLITASIGLSTAPISHQVDARWTMAYSACLGDTQAHYLDTSRPAGVHAHPLFAICPEWPVALASRDLLRQRGLTEAEFRRAVHATHDSHIYRLIEPGDQLTTTGTILELESRRPGTYGITCFDTVDANGELVCRTFHGMLFRQVELMSVNKAPSAALETHIDVPPTAHQTKHLSEQLSFQKNLVVADNLAHTYTDCARIYNPIHTDAAVAKAAGLPGIILHGSASMALAVSAITAHFADDQPSLVRRISGQFRGMVTLPSELELRCYTPLTDDGETLVPFDILNPDGRKVIDQGCVTIAPLPVGGSD